MNYEFGILNYELAGCCPHTNYKLSIMNYKL